MGLSLCALASGSKGNATLVGDGDTKVLVDAGVSMRELVKRLEVAGCAPSELVGVLVTHIHSDHIGGLRTLVNKLNVPVYTHYSNTDYLARRLGSGKNIVELDGTDFYIGGMTVSPFEVGHDVHCYGYSFYQNGKKATVATDLGEITATVLNSIKDSDILVIESNHDIERLKNNANYSYPLKQRIMSKHGHLSNEECSAAVCVAAECGARQVVLAHLSAENNSPELAYTMAMRALKSRNITAGKDVLLSVAMQDCAGSIIKCI